jgi:hypothetical protein
MGKSEFIDWWQTIYEMIKKKNSQKLKKVNR